MKRYFVNYNHNGKNFFARCLGDFSLVMELQYLFSLAQKEEISNVTIKGI